MKDNKCVFEMSLDEFDEGGLRNSFFTCPGSSFKSNTFSVVFDIHAAMRIVRIALCVKRTF